MCNGSVKSNRKYYDNQTIANHEKGHINEKCAKRQDEFDNILVIPTTASLKYTAINICDSETESTLLCNLFKCTRTTLQVIFIENTRPYH